LAHRRTQDVANLAAKTDLRTLAATIKARGRQPGAQCPRHALSIKAIHLGETATARHQEARRVKNNRTDITRNQNPGKPETIATNLIAAAVRPDDVERDAGGGVSRNRVG
jgi:hypothetical protein